VFGGTQISAAGDLEHLADVDDERARKRIHVDPLTCPIPVASLAPVSFPVASLAPVPFPVASLARVAREPRDHCSPARQQQRQHTRVAVRADALRVSACAG